MWQGSTVPARAAERDWISICCLLNSSAQNSSPPHTLSLSPSLSVSTLPPSPRLQSSTADVFALFLKAGSSTVSVEDMAMVVRSQGLSPTMHELNKAIADAGATGAYVPRAGYAMRRSRAGKRRDNGPNRRTAELTKQTRADTNAV